MRSHELATGLLIALSLLDCTPPEPDPQDPASWDARQVELAAGRTGFLVWESNRSGAWRIWWRSLDGPDPRQLTPDESGRHHFAPHVSPDGSRVAYLSYPDPYTSYKDVPSEVRVPLRLVDVASGESREIVPNARTNGESRAVVWMDNYRVTYLDAKLHVRELDLRTGESVPLLPADDAHRGYLVNPTRSYASQEDPTFCVYRGPDTPIVRGPRRSGCQPYFTRDGRWGFWTSHSGGPIERVRLSSGRTGVIVERDDPRLPKRWGYIYFPMVSPGQRLIAFAASRDEHDHFRSDYEIFVAPIDPKTLELTADPVRYTFDPGTDRFPDVYLSGLEFGHHEGEAPFPVRLDPASIPGAAGGEPWRWDFGNGTQATAAVGEHVFREPGRYDVTARRGDTVLHADVHVDEAAPPQPVRVMLRGDDRHVAVHFDEPVDASQVTLRLESGAEIRGFELGPADRSLVLELAQPVARDDHLRVAGVRDREHQPNVLPETRLAIERSEWPSRRDGLLYLFETWGEASPVRDPHGDEERSYRLEREGRARIDHAGALWTSGGVFEVEDLAEPLGKVCSESDAFTFEAMVHIDVLDHPDRGALVSLPDAMGRSLFELIQKGEGLRVRMVAEDFEGSEEPRIVVGTWDEPGPRHVVMSYREDRLVSYLDGQKIADTDIVRGDLDAWEEADKVLFGARQGDRNPWTGRLEGIALYCRFMGAEEAATNAHAYRDRIEARPAVPRVRVRARLLERSDLPTREQITPYDEGLVVHEYEVLNVLEGELGHERIRVAHWAILDGEAQPIGALEPPEQIAIILEPFDQNPQVAPLYRSDTLPLDLDVPLFLDVSP